MTLLSAGRASRVPRPSVVGGSPIPRLSSSMIDLSAGMAR